MLDRKKIITAMPKLPMNFEKRDKLSQLHVHAIEETVS